ncbi:MAG: glycosyltransferase family 2 protein, partial [Lachnospiraceae bacterium]|nr:glycosyltransferase family 2 protein [Lachnospiraceae bacterium]
MKAKMVKIAVALTCHNRREKTLRCVKSLIESQVYHNNTACQNNSVKLDFIIADSGSTDGTKRLLETLEYPVTILDCPPDYFWNAGMGKALSYILTQQEQYDFCLLVNDDVDFFPEAVGLLLEVWSRRNSIAYEPHSLKLNGFEAGTETANNVREKANEQATAGLDGQPKAVPLGEEGSSDLAACVIVGPVCSHSGEMSYGGIRKKSDFLAKFEMVQPHASGRIDTFNGNCVLLPLSLLARFGTPDPEYVHSMADFDYGFAFSKAGVPIYQCKGFVGECEDNPVKGSWRDKSLSIKERLRKKENPKGLPAKDWFYFVKKNYGLMPALYHTLTPYIRI